MLQRVISAIVMRETDPFQSPLRRGTGAIFAGVMIAVLTAAVFGVVGLLTKTGSTAWKTEGAIVVERESGAAFVYQNGELHPMLNYGSALLAGDGIQHVFHAPANSLVDVPRGTTLGIAGAPESLPADDRVVGAPWTLCSVPGHNAAGNPTSKTLLVTGRQPAGGHRISSQALLVKDASDGSVYLIWHGHRYLIEDPDRLLPALFTSNDSPALVGSAWLNALPRGLDIGPITIDSQGQESAAVPGRNNGDLVYTQTPSGRQYYVVLDDGLARLTGLQRYIVAAYTSNASPQQISTQEATSAPQSSELKQDNGDASPPSTAPALFHIDASFDESCATFANAGNVPSVVVGGTFDNLGSGVPTTAQTSGGTSLANRVIVPPGHIALVKPMASDTETTGGAYTLVTDSGIRYPVPSAGVLEKLGYTPDEAVPMPASLVLRIPAGPTLNPKNARKPAK